MPHEHLYVWQIFSPALNLRIVICAGPSTWWILSSVWALAPYRPEVICEDGLRFAAGHGLCSFSCMLSVVISCPASNCLLHHSGRESTRVPLVSCYWGGTGFTGICFYFSLRFLFSALMYRLVGLVVKASTSRAEDPGFESCLHCDFSRLSHTSDLKIGTPGVTGSMLGLVGQVSVYCDWVRWKVWSATSNSVWQYLKLSEQIHPWDTLACC